MMSDAEPAEGGVESGRRTGLCWIRWQICLHLGHNISTNPLQTAGSRRLRQWGRLPSIWTNR